MSCPELACIDPARIGEFWPIARHLVKKAMERGGGDFERTEREIFAGLQLLWLAHNGAAIEAAAVSQLTGETCTIVACGGSGRERWLHLMQGIEDYAKAEGCRAMRIIGRKGWERVLSGFEVKSVVLEKEIT